MEVYFNQRPAPIQWFKRASGRSNRLIRDLSRNDVICILNKPSDLCSVKYLNILQIGANYGFVVVFVWYFIFECSLIQNKIWIILYATKLRSVKELLTQRTNLNSLFTKYFTTFNLGV